MEKRKNMAVNSQWERVKIENAELNEIINKKNQRQRKMNVERVEKTLKHA